LVVQKLEEHGMDMSQQAQGCSRHPWLGVEVRHLATLIAVARTGSFRSAATELGYVQSALSQHVVALERAVGTRLIERQRGHRHVSLTPAGEVLVARSQRIIGELSAARVEVTAVQGPDATTMHLAVDAGIAPWLLQQTLPRVTRALPSLRLHVSEATEAADFAGGLETGAFDAAIGVGIANEKLTTRPLTDDPFVVLARRGTRLSDRAMIATLADLDGERLIAAAATLADAHVRAAGLRLDDAVAVPFAAAVQPLVKRGIGAGLVPRSAAPEPDEEVDQLPVSDVIPARSVVIAWHAARKRTTVLESFSAAAANALAQ
jgi:DNA-binding transcriptional LysR family regulator